MAYVYSPLLEEIELTLEEAAFKVLESARREGGLAGVLVDDDALQRLAARLIWDQGVQVGRELGEDG